MSLTQDTVRKVAVLARLEMDETELARMTPQVSGILSWIEMLGEVNTNGVEPLASVVDNKLRLRDDVVNDGNCQYAVLANAPESVQGFFVVPKVVE